jgi:DNA-binding response OmpR family regulator
MPARGEGVRDDAPLVLVVEDNPEMNRFIVETLSADYRVASAFDGREGLEQTLALKPDLVITDLMMPHMGGNELVEEMRRRGLVSETPVLVLTAKTDDEARAELLSGGAQDYLIKPFALAELRARAGNLVTTARTRSFLREELKSQQADLGELAHEVKLRRQELEETLRERNLLLQSEQKARRAAEEANQLKDEFLATVSHELRTPLTAMIGWVHMLRDGSLDEVSVKRAIDSIDRNSKAQAQIVDDLLDTSRIITGKLGLRVSQVALPNVVEAALDAVRFAAQAKNIEVSFDPPEDSEGGDFDRRRRSGAPATDRVESALQRRQVHRTKRARRSQN